MKIKRPMLQLQLKNQDTVGTCYPGITRNFLDFQKIRWVSQSLGLLARIYDPNWLRFSRALGENVFLERFLGASGK